MRKRVLCHMWTTKAQMSYGPGLEKICLISYMNNKGTDVIWARSWENVSYVICEQRRSRWHMGQVMRKCILYHMWTTKAQMSYGPGHDKMRLMSYVNNKGADFIWARSWENASYIICEQQRHRCHMGQVMRKCFLYHMWTTKAQMSYGPGHEKMLLISYVNKKGADDGIWARSWENVSYIICEQQRRRCHMGQVIRKRVLYHMWTTKAQMSSGPGHEKMHLMSYVNNKGADVIWTRSWENASYVICELQRCRCQMDKVMRKRVLCHMWTTKEQMAYGPGHEKMHLISQVNNKGADVIWARSWENASYVICEQQRRRCHMGQVMRKRVLCHMWTTKVQMSYGPGHEKMHLMSYVNNKGADVIWARSWEKVSYVICEQQRHRCHMGQVMRKRVLYHMWTTKAQMAYGPGHEKMHLISYVNNKGADVIWARSWENASYIICVQQRHRCHMGQVMRKCILYHMWTTKAQMSYGPGHEKMHLISYVNNKGADVIWARSWENASYVICEQQRSRWHMGQVMRKCILYHRWTTNAQMSYGPGHEKTCLMLYVNNKGADVI